MSPRVPSDGLNTFDLLDDFSSTERTLTRIFLRNIEMSEKALYAAITTLPEKKQMTKKEMKTALQNLTKKGWLKEKRIGLKTLYTIQQQQNRR
jgi:predicted transcriptional regulator